MYTGRKKFLDSPTYGKQEGEGINYYYQTQDKDEALTEAGLSKAAKSRAVAPDSFSIIYVLLSLRW